MPRYLYFISYVVTEREKTRTKNSQISWYSKLHDIDDIHKIEKYFLDHVEYSASSVTITNWKEFEKKDV